VIAVPQALRPSGNEMVRLAKPLRDNVAELIKSVDEFNAIIDTTDPVTGTMRASIQNTRLTSRRCFD
jgi:hypothetical protein